MKAEDFDRKFDDREDVFEFLDLEDLTGPGRGQKEERINVNDDTTSSQEDKTAESDSVVD